jgi:hypothetical protein
MKTIKLAYGKETFPIHFTGMVEWPEGRKEWFVDGLQHREDGPARVWPNGAKEWWLDDNRVFLLDSIGEYIVIQEGLPSTMEWLGKPVPTLKVLTAEGIKFIPKLPGV